MFDLISRVWNGQFLSYAGYRIDEHTIIGDRAHVEFTDVGQTINF